MRRLVPWAVSLLLSVAFFNAQLLAQQTRIRIAIVGLDHDHVWGLLKDIANEPQANLVAIAEANPALVKKAKSQLAAGVSFYSDYGPMLDEAKPEAVFVTTERDRRKSGSQKDLTTGSTTVRRMAVARSCISAATAQKGHYGSKPAPRECMRQRESSNPPSTIKWTMTPQLCLIIQMQQSALSHHGIGPMVWIECMYSGQRAASWRDEMRYLCAGSQ